MAKIETYAWKITDANFKLLSKSQDNGLSSLCTTLGPVEHCAFAQVFPGMVATIIAQQLSDKAYNSLLLKLPDALFASPELLLSLIERHEQELRCNKVRLLPLSGSKLNTLKAIAALFGPAKSISMSESHLAAMASLERAQLLQALKGIGPWSVNMMEMLVFHNEDVFSIHDLGLQNAVLHLSGKRRQELTKKQLLELMERYMQRIEPLHLGTYIAFYLWQLNAMLPASKEQFWGIVSL